MEELEFLQKLHELGVKPGHLSITDDQAAKIRDIILDGRGVNQETAREIMGQNFLGPEDVEKHLGIKYTVEEKKSLSWVPFSKKTLTDAVKENCILFCGGANITLEILAKKLPGDFNGGDPPWYVAERQKFFKQEFLKARWYLLRKDIEPMFLNRKWLDIKSDLEYQPRWKNKEVGSAVLYGYIALLWLKAKNERLFKNPLYKSTASYSLYEEYASVWTASQTTGGVLAQNEKTGEWEVKSATLVTRPGVVRMSLNRQNQISFIKSEKDLASSDASVALLWKVDDPAD